MEAILAKVLEQFRARFTGKGLNTALRAVHRQESGRQRYRPKLLRLTEERSPVLTCFLDACSSTSFLRPRSGWLERKPRKKAELWGTNWSQMAPPPQSLSHCPVSLLWAGFMTLQLQHLEDLAWKTFRHVLPAQHEGSLAENQSLQQVLEYVWCFSLSWMGWWTPSFLF